MIRIGIGFFISLHGGPTGEGAESTAYLTAYLVAFASLPANEPAYRAAIGILPVPKGPEPPVVVDGTAYAPAWVISPRGEILSYPPALDQVPIAVGGGTITGVSHA